jgi:hypothetical protein
MRLIFLATAWVAVGACADERPTVQLPAVNLPVLGDFVQAARLASDAVVITLQSDGSVHADDRRITLAELPRGETMRLRIDRDAPWAHVQWLVHSIGRKNERVRLQLTFVSNDGVERVLDSSVAFRDAGEPPSTGSNWFPLIQLTAVVLSADQIRCGERRATSPSSVGSWVREAQSLAQGDSRLDVAASIRPHPLAAWGAVAAVYEQMRAADLLHVEFDGYAPIRRSNRTLKRLPPPKVGEPWKYTGYLGNSRTTRSLKTDSEFHPYDRSPEMEPEVEESRTD